MKKFQQTEYLRLCRLASSDRLLRYWYLPGSGAPSSRWRNIWGSAASPAQTGSSGTYQAAGLTREKFWVCCCRIHWSPTSSPQSGIYEIGYWSKVTRPAMCECRDDGQLYTLSGIPAAARIDKISLLSICQSRQYRYEPWKACGTDRPSQYKSHLPGRYTSQLSSKQCCGSEMIFSGSGSYISVGSGSGSGSCFGSYMTLF